MFTPTISYNSSVRIFLGTSQGELVDIFTSKGQAFSGFNVSSERVDDKDLRNGFMRLVFPKDLKPSEYYLNFSLTDQGKEEIKLKGKTTLTLSIRTGGQTRNASFVVLDTPSWNCK